MSTNPGQPPPSQGGGPQTTGFIVLEEILTELGKMHRCRRLDQWTGDARRRLKEHCAQVPGDRVKKDVGRVLRAYEAAEELVRGIHDGKIKRQ